MGVVEVDLTDSPVKAGTADTPKAKMKQARLPFAPFNKEATPSRLKKNLCSKIWHFVLVSDYTL